MSDAARDYKSYEYKELSIPSDKAGFYLDSYASFGWVQNDDLPPQGSRTVTFHLKRDRKLVNKAELTRLQRHFEADLEQLRELERSKTSAARLWAALIGLLGTALMAGSVFAVTATPPRIGLCILLAVPAFAGWIAPYFVYRAVRARKTRQLTPYIEEKIEELYSLCEKGQALL